ncbi:hypothetical protein [Nodosilinea sp. P-1105]|uniref:hypothetical protein n=1 Tax=Nodosilinea sp. P-1105 TaxID=2546229 RepID=UPI00146D2147|nr:hypothetical protein [Nodosilinea sp. P-1105]
MLPEDQVPIFKFWFDGSLQAGTHHRNELYYRALTVDVHQRSRLYHLACRLSRHRATTLVSLASDQCSLWVSLRDHAVAASLLPRSALGLSHAQR